MHLDNYIIWAPGELLPRWIGPWWILALALFVIVVAFFAATWFAARWVTIRNRSKNRLRRIWTTFLKNIPGEFRRYIMLYQPFVVFGESGSGKSSLIGRYTDWKGQAAQFYPSYNVDPLLQIYLGSRALVQEIPSTLLAETSPNARRALVRLWKPIFSAREPIAVITISAAALRKATPESLRSQAQVLRGKINVLSNISNKPVQTRVVLTHMDQVEGYLAYSQFVEKNGVPHQLQLDPKAPDGNLAHCLEPQEKYLPLALTTLSAKNYLKVLTFLNKAPETFENLGALLRALKEPDPLSFEPRIEDLYLTSDQGGSPSAVSNPFAASWTDHHVSLEKAMVRRHGRITKTIAAVGISYFMFSFFYERHQLNEAARTIAELEKATIKDELARDAAEKIHVLEGAQSSAINMLLPNFFRGATAKLKSRYVSTIRESYLRHLYLKLNTSKVKNAQEFAIFLTSLVYASNDNELGRYILPPGDGPEIRDERERRLQEWALALTIDGVEQVPTPIIRSYVELSDAPYDGKIDLPETLAGSGWRSSVTARETWTVFLERIANYMDTGTISPRDLERLRGTSREGGSTLVSARQLKEDFDALRRRRTGKDAFALLQKKDTHFPRRPFQQYLDEVTVPDWLAAAASSLDSVLDAVLDESWSELTVAEHSGSAPLENLNLYVRSIRSRDISGGKAISFKLQARDADKVFDVDRWRKTVNAGRIQSLVEQFLAAHGDSRAKIFLPTAVGTSGQPVEMRVPTASNFAFSGAGGVPVEYTRAFYERDVQRKITTFEEVFDVAPVSTAVKATKKIEIDDALKARLLQVVENAAEQYALDYFEAWRRFYRDWSIDANDVNTMRSVISQMSLSSSRFEDFLVKVQDNTSFEGSRSRIQNAIFVALEPFRKINKLQDSERGRNAEIEKYRSILQGIVADLDGKPADKSKDATSAEEMRRTPLEFDQLLPPAGRIAFAILHETRESKTRTVEEWLKANGIEGEWKRPFLEPVQKLGALGVQDIESLVRRSWDKRVLSQAAPLLDMFPFNRNALTEATPQLCEEVLLPKTGLFWVAWKNLVAPVCVYDETANGWKPMKGLESLNNDPRGMFDVVSGLARVTRTLWEKDSIPKPLKFDIQPQPLPVTRLGRPAIVTSFLQSGRSSVFGFNQKLYNQTLSIEWWNRPPASVGMQVGDPGSNTKSFRSINEPESAWSFYRLLLRDRHAEQRIWVWDLTQGEPEYPAPLLKFQFKEDPWAVFSVPGYESTTDKVKKEDTK